MVIPPQTLEAELTRILRALGFTGERAKDLAKIFTGNTVDGVASHGINRFPRFVEHIQEGVIQIHASPVKKQAMGAMERWDGCLGPGPLNARTCTDRAMTLARQNGLGLVALANTNHWMRGGTYAWQAVQSGMAFIGWTNTTANMPAWGAKDCRLGNNPLVLAVPYETEAIVLDMAMTQFSYGTMESAHLPLPLPGGYDAQGQLTCDPKEILATKRPLPIGYWKGTGLSLLLDLLATLLSGGQSTSQISTKDREYGVSQVFIALDLSQLGEQSALTQAVHQIIEDYSQSMPASETNTIIYPGQRVVQRRQDHLKNGIPVDRSLWETLQKL
ncbi:MAG: 3-dehydro-L-gulonate 2-dehydrogenase [Phycisphaeraceae bacterium]|nr:3-dehydro-L-gulonate 2-dehydrogenase [Phycisphaeraceae bacterium]